MELWLALYALCLMVGVALGAAWWFTPADPQSAKFFEPWKSELGVAAFLATHSVFPVFWGAWGIVGLRYEPARPYATAVMASAFVASAIYLLLTYYSRRGKASVDLLRPFKRVRNMGFFLALFGLLHGWAAWVLLWPTKHAA